VWLYVPSHCLLGSEDSTSQSDWHESAASCVTWKGSAMRPASLLRAWQMKPWMKRLSGLTLPPSTASRGVAQWISSLPAHRASPTVSPGRERDSMTNGAGQSSRMSPESSRKSRPNWSFWKTSGSGGQADFFASSENSYSDWVSESLRRSRLLRETLARRISASADSVWPTATAQDSCGSRAGPEYGTKTRNAGTTLIRQWPTPNARDHKGAPRDPKARGRTTGQLDEAAEVFFPPAPNDAADWSAILAEQPERAPALESDFRRVVDGVAAPLHERANRLRCTGNGVVPLCGAVAFHVLVSDAGIPLPKKWWPK